MVQSYSVMERVLAELDKAPDDIIELMGSESLCEMTVRALTKIGAMPAGNQRSVDLLVAYFADDLAISMRAWQATLQSRKPGRPRVPFGEAAVYAAAFHHFIDLGAGRAKAAGAAASLLGAPATKDRVQKGERRFRWEVGELAHQLALHGRSEEAVEQYRASQVQLLGVIWTQIEAHAAAIERERADHASRRKDARHARYIGAERGGSIGSSNNGDDR